MHTQPKRKEGKEEESRERREGEKAGGKKEERKEKTLALFLSVCCIEALITVTVTVIVILKTALFFVEESSDCQVLEGSWLAKNFKGEVNTRLVFQNVSIFRLKYRLGV